ncbi:hypothetical protein ATO11_11135 [Pseudaestuariivita atlantica]|uniref:Hydroxyneurosporene synthase n=2 Tax=Pseudaestuariivita atlantica TaxID=1317121 RepID=A0A0L1JQA8_9RHOB|nr:hypothetical protein ATO11_11135 [Pseudaestuariivita atlantica]
MTDRGRSALRLSDDVFRVGPSSMRWTGSELVIDINEMGAPPMVTRVRGQVRLTPRAITGVELPLTDDGAHVWRPFAPVSDISVSLESKGWQWSGHGYFDANFGTRALEEDFGYWTWGRFPTAGGATCYYDATRLDGSTLKCAATFDKDGEVRLADLPPAQPMARTIWALRRECRADPGTRAEQLLPMLDAPFYTRAGVKTRLNGEWTTGVHEALDLTRFRSPLLKPMLAVRVPRVPRWNFTD